MVNDKRNSNHAQPTEFQNASPRPTADPDSDITSTASFGGSDGNFEYINSTENSPSILAIKPDLAGHTSKLENMYEILVEEIDAIVRPMMIFTHTN